MQGYSWGRKGALGGAEVGEVSHGEVYKTATLLWPQLMCLKVKVEGSLAARTWSHAVAPTISR